MEAVYYDLADHAGVWRRLLVDLVDSAIAGFVALLLSMIIGAMLQSFEMATLAVWMTWAAVWFCYFVIWKGSRFRTVGYVLAGVKIVDLNGQRPTRLALLLRLAFAVLGPANLLIDLVWISSDPGRQALRDKFAHTYVVRSAAIPAGRGVLTYPIYNVFGWTLMFAEVRPAA